LSTTFWYLIAALLTVLGVLGSVLPLLPGVPLVFAGLALAAWVDDFAHVSGFTLGLLGGLTGLAMLIDVLASAFGTRIAGASGWAFLGAGVGGLVGVFFAPAGLLVGPLLGAVLLELAVTRHPLGSVKAGAGVGIGIVLGAAAKIALIVSMLALFALAWWWP